MNRTLQTAIAALLICSSGSFLAFKMVTTPSFANESATAQPNEAPIDRRFQPIIDAIQTQMEAQTVPGVAVAIVHHGEIIFQQGFGVRSLETRDPVTPDTLFRIGSATKPFTVIALMQLVEAGRVDLDAPVVTYVPTFQVDPTITVRQLISHTAGLADLAVPYGRTDATALQDFVASLPPQSAIAPPGKVLSYSNPGFNVAGAIIERVTGESYARYIDENVFATLGMTRTTFQPTVALTYPLAVGYQPLATEMAPVRPTPDNAAEYPAGFAFSSVRDLTQFLQFLMQEGAVNGQPVLRADSVQAMKTPVLWNEPLKLGYGLGLFVAEEDGTTTIGHGGSIPGYTTALKIFPEQDLGLVLVANRSGFDPSAILDAVRQTLLNLPEPPQTPPLPLDVNALRAYAGNYGLANAMGDSIGTLEIALEQGSLKGRAPGQPEMELRPTRPDVFELWVAGQTVGEVAFLRDETGQVTFFTQGLRAFPRSESATAAQLD